MKNIQKLQYLKAYIKYINYIILFLFLFLINFNTAKCINLSSPINPAKIDKDRYIGIFFGLGQNIQDGIKLVTCDSCFFSNGLKFGYDIGILYEQQFTNNLSSFIYKFNWGIKAFYSDLGVNANFIENKYEYFDNYNMSIPFSLQHLNTISISNVGIMPFVKYNCFDFLFFSLGVNFNYFLNDFMEHKIKLLEKTKTLPNGEVVSISIPGKKDNISEYVVENGDIIGINKFYLSLMPAIGFDFNLSEKIKLSTIFNYSTPLTDILNDYEDNFLINTWRLAVELKYNFANKNNIYRK